MDGGNVGGGTLGTTIETTIAQAAARQHGVVTRAQLLAVGLTVDRIRSRVHAGRLVPLHHGVYLLGNLLEPLRPAHYREMPAVLACGRGAAVGRRNALWLVEVVSTRPRGPVHVVLAGGRCRRPGVVAHRTASLPATDVEVVDGIPTTVPVRSIIDTAADATPRELEQIIARATRLGRLDLDRLRDRVERENGRPGVVRLRAILAGPTPAFTRSPLEEQLLQLVRKAGLPEPQCNVRLGDYEMDAFWPDHGVAVEVDGFAYHASRHSFEHDRARDFALAARGIDVQRLTWRQINERPFVVIRRLAAVLARAEARRDAAAAGSHDE
ncbi:MAG TPA: type IV toxin-antitoxin system AbiEi family antitoxin domain-containing protein [Longimicrobiales bacterium]|nr:type IV toxin-antitoxin system AbiEi family antitoxin domain-containing protein [Longimicrobiales bacterium]